MDRSVPANVTYSQEQLARFSASVVENPIAIGENPYLVFPDSGDSRLLPRENVVCGVQVTSENPLHYRLASYESVREAKAVGASVTHFSACGTCSTLQDLSVYLARPNLTTPVRRCALLGFSKALTVNCLKDLGFTQSCSETWYYNARHTAKRCGSVCLKSWFVGEPPNGKDGGLNGCLSCDEKFSGPVFKLSAGRTRRNSGIASAIKREEGEQAVLAHDY